jgi:hypothetical protein
MAPFMLASGINHLALIGNFLPRKCGIATYTTDTYNALVQRYPGLQVDVYAMDDHPGRYAYPPEVTRAIPQNDRGAYIDAARAIEASGAQALWIQHEYGIYGGSAGRFPARAHRSPDDPGDRHAPHRARKAQRRRAPRDGGFAAPLPRASSSWPSAAATY